MRTLGRSALASRLYGVAALFTVCWTLAGATPASAQITFNVHSPQQSMNGQPPVYSEPVPISVSVASPTEVLSVKATVGDRTTNLAFDISGNVWTGSLSLDGLPRGQQTMVIEATNAGDQTAQVQRVFIYDKLPVLTLTAPVEFAVGQPEIPIQGQCLDDGPTCIVSVSTNVTQNILVVSGSFNTVVVPPEGTQNLTFRASDSTGRYAEITRQVFVTSKGGLSVAGSFQGKILDIDEDRALTFDDTVRPRVVRLYDRAANTNQIIWTGPNPDPNDPNFPDSVNKGFLTPNNGALFVVSTQADIFDPLFEWRSGALTQIANVSLSTLRVQGAWATFQGLTGPCCLSTTIFVRDLVAGTTYQSPVDGQDPDVSPDGRAVFHRSPTSYQVWEFDPLPAPGTITQLTFSDPLWSVFARTDGVNVAFIRSTDAFLSPKSIVLRTEAGTEEVLATDLATASADFDYRVAGGFVAFVRNGSGGSRQVWLRIPDGSVRQLSSTGGRASIEALSSTGDVIYTTTTVVNFTSDSKRFLHTAGGVVRELGVPFGQARFVDGAPFIVAGNQVLSVGPEPQPRAILSEGATGTFFSTDIALLNPALTARDVTVRYFRENLPEIVENRVLPARSRTTIHVDEVPGLEGASVSTQVEGAQVVAERLMSWDDATAYGGHLGNAVGEPRRKWLFAEGAQGFFFTFFLLANSGAEDATVRFKFLVEQGDPVEHSMTVPAGSRETFYAGDLAALVNRSFATVIDSDLPIVAERAMYFGTSLLFLGGHGSPGVTQPAQVWFHAEGATGSLFDTFILIANPNPVDAPVFLQFITDTGVTVSRMKNVPAFGRLTVNLEDEGPELATAAVSTRVSSIGVPIVSERAMYWDTTGSGVWREAHNSFGVTAPGLKWALAEGRAGGDRGYQTFVLVSNNEGDAANLEVTFIREDGTTVEKTYTVQPNQRYNITMTDIPQLANSSFATIVESVNGVRINVESAIYWNSGGVTWEAGGNTVATPIP